MKCKEQLTQIPRKIRKQLVMLRAISTTLGLSKLKAWTYSAMTSEIPSFRNVRCRSILFQDYWYKKKLFPTNSTHVPRFNFLIRKLKCLLDLKCKITTVSSCTREIKVDIGKNFFMERVVKLCNGEVVESVSRDDLGDVQSWHWGTGFSDGTQYVRLMIGLCDTESLCKPKWLCGKIPTILHLHPCTVPYGPTHLGTTSYCSIWSANSEYKSQIIMLGKLTSSKMNTQKHGLRFHNLHPWKKNQLNILTWSLSSHLYCCSRSFQTLLQQFHYR